MSFIFRHSSGCGRDGLRAGQSSDSLEESSDVPMLFRWFHVTRTHCLRTPRRVGKSRKESERVGKSQFLLCTKNIETDTLIKSVVFYCQ